MTTTKKLNYRKLLVIFVFQQHWEKLPVFHKSINLTWNIQNLNRKVKPWEIVILIQPTLYGTSISKIFSIFLKAHPPPPPDAAPCIDSSPTKFWKAPPYVQPPPCSHEVIGAFLKAHFMRNRKDILFAWTP